MPPAATTSRPPSRSLTIRLSTKIRSRPSPLLLLSSKRPPRSSNLSRPSPRSNPLQKPQPRSPSSRQKRPPLRLKPSRPRPRRSLNPKPNSRFSLQKRRPARLRAGRSVVSPNNRLPAPIRAAKPVQISVLSAMRIVSLAMTPARPAANSRRNRATSFVRANRVASHQANAASNSVSARSSSANVANNRVPSNRSPRPPWLKPKNPVSSAG